LAPDFWTAEDVVRIHGDALVANLPSEATRAQVACMAGPAADALRRKLEPPHTVQIPGRLDPIRARGGYTPLLFSRAAVIVRLRP